MISSLSSVLDPVLSLLGLTSESAAAPLDVHDEASRALEAQLASARAVETKAKALLDRATTSCDEAARAEHDAATFLAECVDTGASDERIASAKGAHDVASLRRRPIEARRTEAADALAIVQGEIAKTEAELARVAAEVARAELVASASIERLRADNADDESYVIEELPKVLAALSRITARFDAANTAAEQAGLAPLDVMHAFGGILARLIANDPRYARRFLLRANQLRHKVEAATYDKPTRLPLDFVRDLLDVPFFAAEPHDVDDVTEMFKQRTAPEAEAVLKQRDGERVRARAEALDNDRAEIARREAYAAEQRRLACGERANYVDLAAGKPAPINPALDR